MTKSFNLVDMPFVPVVGQSRRFSLKELFSNEDLTELDLDPWLYLPILRLLLCIGQAAVTAQTDNELDNLTLGEFEQKALNYLDTWHDAFDLYGDKPFLQVKGAGAVKNPLAISAYTPYAAFGNNPALRSGQNLVNKHYSDEDKALLLPAVIMHSMGGKRIKNEVILTPGYRGKLNDKGKAASGAISPFLGMTGMLYSYYAGRSILETVWINQLSEESISAASGSLLTLGRPCWELNIDGEDCADARSMKNSYAGRLVPLTRFCLLLDGDLLACTDGIAHLTLKDHCFDFAQTVKVNAKTQALQALPPGSSRMTWRDLTAFMSFLRRDQLKPEDWCCKQLQLCYKRVLKTGSLKVWCGGAAVKTQTGEQKISGAGDLISSKFSLWDGSAAFTADSSYEDYKKKIQELEQKEKFLYVCVTRFFDDLIKVGDPTENKKRKNSYPQALAAGSTFWERLAPLQNTLVHLCFNDVHDDKEVLEKRYYDAVWSTLCSVYDETCPSSTARTLLAHHKNHPAFIQTKANK